MIAKWRGISTCQYRLMCTDLSNNICGDYAVSINGQDVCYEKQILSGELESGEDLDLELWQTNDARFEAKCLFFCNKQGQVPQRHQPTENDLVLSLVRHIHLLIYIIVKLQFQLLSCSNYSLMAPDKLNILT